MSDFVYDGTSLPGTKSDYVTRPDIPVSQQIVAAEFNTVTAAVADLRSATLAGQFRGLTDGAATLQTRAREGRLQSRYSTGEWRTDVDPNSLHVRDFGAVGDGVTDDSTAIQAAIAAAQTSGQVLCFEGLTYRCARPLHIWQHCRLIGVGRSLYTKTRLVFPLHSPGVLLHRDTYSVSGDAFGATISGICLDGGTQASRAVGLLGFTRFRLERGAMRRWGTGVSVYGHAVVRVSVTGKTGWASGAFVASPSGATGAIIADSTETGSGDVWCDRLLSGPNILAGDTLTVATAGVTMSVSSAATEVSTNSSSWQMEDVWCDAFSVVGILVRGGDANAGVARDVEIENAPLAVWDDSFLGNTWDHVVTEGNTKGFHAPGYAQTGQFVNCYSENSVPDFIVRHNTILGGTWALTNTGGCARINNSAIANVEFHTPHTLTAVIGSADGGNQGALLSVVDPTYGTSYLNYRRDPYGVTQGHGARIFFWNSQGGPATAYAITAPRTAMGGGGQFLVSVGGVEKLAEHDDALLNFPRAHFEKGLRREVGSLAGVAAHRDTWDVGSILWDSAAGDSLGWLVTEAGTTGVYGSAVTATGNGTTTVVLSALDPLVSNQLRIGEYLVVGTTRVRVEAYEDLALSFTASAPVPAGSGLPVAYAPPTFAPLIRPSHRTLAVTDVAVNMPAGSADLLRLDLTSAAPLTFTAAPTLVKASVQGAGSEVTLTNVGANAITLSDHGTLSGSALHLSTATFAMATGDSLKLVIDSLGEFHESWRIVV